MWNRAGWANPSFYDALLLILLWGKEDENRVNDLFAGGKRCITALSAEKGFGVWVSGFRCQVSEFLNSLKPETM